MYEVEIKLPAEHEPVRKALAASGATRLGELTQRDMYYDAPHRDFADSDEALRLREETAEERTAVLTYKGPKVDPQAKTRIEHETVVDSPAALGDILTSLGFSPAATVEKTRERYELDEILVSLDTVAGVGSFVEAETEAKADGLDAARETVEATLRQLGLEPDEQIRRSYLELVLEAE
ncbi:MAG: class IV adenylate cyclase [Halodesulfurarchaeum sp.]